jgi:hypothetical protein
MSIDIKHAKICLIYVYYERKNQQKNQTNLAYFIKYAMDSTKWLKLNITYVFVINGYICNVDFPNVSNVHVLKYPNSSDYEGWYKGVIHMCNLHKQLFWKKYDYLCLMNASTCGPFMEEDINSHWLCPFYHKMVKDSAIACSPYINKFESNDIGSNNPKLSCHFTLIKINGDVMNRLMNMKVISDPKKNTPDIYYNTVLGPKKNKLDAVLTGEFGLSNALQIKYKITCLYYENIDLIEYGSLREEFYNSNNDLLKNTIFIKNIWRNTDIDYASSPVLYKYCSDFINTKLKMNNIFNDLPNDLSISYNYDLLNISLKNKKQYYNLFGYAEEYIIFPIKGTTFNTSCVIYAHYDANNIISDYVIQGLKTLIYLGYDVLFYTTSSEINNIDLSILPFSVNFINNSGVGGDWKMLLNGLQNIKNNNLKYEWIMFINDSLLFPINGINNYVNTVNAMRQNCDFWGHWESNEISWHIIGTPIEFKYELLDSVINYINTVLPLCICDVDYIAKLETKFAQYLKDRGYKYNIVITDKMLSYPINTCCPAHHPCVINQWINNPKSFAIKWKYCISYLNENAVSHYFNYLTRFLYYGHKSPTISKGESCGAFPKSKNFTPKIK